MGGQVGQLLVPGVPPLSGIPLVLYRNWPQNLCQSPLSAGREGAVNFLREVQRGNTLVFFGGRVFTLLRQTQRPSSTVLIEVSHALPPAQAAGRTALGPIMPRLRKGKTCHLVSHWARLKNGGSVPLGKCKGSWGDFRPGPGLNPVTAWRLAQVCFEKRNTDAFLGVIPGEAR